MAVLISTVGRSGSSIFFDALGAAMRARNPAVREVYEPYLWTPAPIPLSKRRFTTSELNIEGIHVHCQTPLFLAGRNALHDAWLRQIFAPVPGQSLGNVLVKMIRGCGRLEAMLTLLPDLKVIVITRNVVDTVNSGLGMFSFFGDEFHPSDKRRFPAELAARFGVQVDTSQLLHELDWAVLWWRYMTAASFDVAARYPGRVMLVAYEDFALDRVARLKSVLEFLSIDAAYCNSEVLSRPAGPVTGHRHIDMAQITALAEPLNWYLEQLEQVGFLLKNREAMAQNILLRCEQRAYRAAIMANRTSAYTATQWRHLAHRASVRRSAAF